MTRGRGEDIVRNRDRAVPKMVPFGKNGYQSLNLSAVMVPAYFMNWPSPVVQQN